MPQPPGTTETTTAEEPEQGDTLYGDTLVEPGAEEGDTYVPLEGETIEEWEDDYEEYPEEDLPPEEDIYEEEWIEEDTGY